MTSTWTATASPERWRMAWRRRALLPAVLGRMAMISWALLYGPVVCAGEHKLATSRSAALFLAITPEAKSELAVHLASQPAFRFVNEHCRAGRAVYDLVSRLAKRCHMEVAADAPSEWGFLSIHDETGYLSERASHRPVSVYALQQPVSPPWKLRAASRAEIEALRKAVPRGKAVPATLHWSQARKASGGPGGVEVWFVADRRWVDIDKDESGQNHWVFRRDNGRKLRLLGIISDAPEALVTVPGHPWPAAWTSHPCDGWCESLVEITDDLPVISTLSGH